MGFLFGPGFESPRLHKQSKPHQRLFLFYDRRVMPRMKADGGKQKKENEVGCFACWDFSRDGIMNA